MLKFISKTLLSIIMEPKAREKLEKISDARKAYVASQQSPHDSAPPDNMPMDKPPYVEPDNEIDVNLKPPRKETSERRELIRKALEVHRSKSTILDGLSLENKMKLRILASEIFKNPSSLK